MSKKQKWAASYFVAFLIMIFLNYWSATNVGSVANENDTIIQPAGYAFSIWGLIYILLLIWIIKMYFSKNTLAIVAKLKFWPVLNFLLNGLWILVFTAGWTGTSTIVIALLLMTIIKMYLTITNMTHHWFDRLPLSIYFSWVTSATIVNIFTLAVSVNMDSFLKINELSWTLIAVAGTAVLAIYVALKFKDWLYPLVMIWTYSGIYSDNSNQIPSLDIILILSAVVLIVVTFVEGLKKINSRKNNRKLN